MRKLIIPIVILMFVIGCTQNIKPISEMTPKEKATFFLSVYNDQAINYKTLASDPTLTEDQKVILRQKKKLMTEVYPLIFLYSSHVDSGEVPDHATEMAIINYLDRLGKMVSE